MKQFVLCAFVVLALCVAGCSNKPKPITAPALNAATAGAEAMKLYDKDGDGKISGAELDATPALKASLKWLDKNGDGGISADEIANEVKAWQAGKVGLCTPMFSITYGGKPVKSGEITLTPEPFMGSGYHPATAKIQDGSCSPSCDASVNPEGLPGMPWGFYTITFSNVPNAPDKMGVEVSNMNTDASDNGSYKLELRVKK